MIVELGRASELTQSFHVGFLYDGGLIQPFLRIVPWH
jgi:hypothetical protein